MDSEFSATPIRVRIANAEQQRVHTLLVIGSRDMQSNAVSVRVRGKGNLGAKPKSEVIAGISAAIKERKP